MEGHLQLGGHRTWYRVVGDLDASAPQAPVIICHGGPGATHDYVAPIADQLQTTGRACVLYDQLGNGRSDHLPDADPSFWTVELFERELTALADHLGIDGRYHVIGQSWGGMLALLHALERPAGLLSVVAADSPSSIPGFVAGCNELLDAMDPAVSATIRAGERSGETVDAGVPGRGHGVLQAPRLPGRSVARRGRAQLRGDGERPDGLRHHERADRVHRRGDDPGLRHHRSPARDRGARSCSSPARTTRCART